MLNKLAAIAMLIADNPSSNDNKYWRTKVARNEFDLDAYLLGFKSNFVKEASCDTYLVASELGILLGKDLLNTIKKVS